MTDTIRLSAEDIARALTKLLINYHKQEVESQGTVPDDEGKLADTEQSAPLLLENADEDDAQPDPFHEPTVSGRHTGADGLAGAPWENTTGLMPKALNLPMSPVLYAKMLWITNNVPKMSLQKIARMGAEMAADKIIAEHYKPGPGGLLQHEQGPQP
nr:hypothetical protein [uncultured Duganella sp.]